MYNNPSGFRYRDFEDIINTIARQKSFQYKKIGYFDREDLEQEVKIKCWSILEKFDPKNGDVRSFFTVCADNRIRDIKRSVVYKHNKPCFKCPFWDQMASSSGVHDCVVFENKMECEKYSKHEKYVQAKISSSHPIDINNENLEDQKYNNTVIGIDFFDYLYNSLPASLSGSLNTFILNNFSRRSISPKDRTDLIRHLKSIMSNKERK